MCWLSLNCEPQFEHDILRIWQMHHTFSDTRWNWQRKEACKWRHIANIPKRSRDYAGTANTMILFVLWCQRIEMNMFTEGVIVAF